MGLSLHITNIKKFKYEQSNFTIGKNKCNRF
jgi:hypothetical protein